MVVAFRPVLRSPMVMPAQDERQHTMALSAQEVELGATDLRRMVEDCHTVDEAMELFRLATTLRNELDRVVVRALDMADACSGK